MKKYLLFVLSLFFFSFQGEESSQIALNNSDILEFKAGHESKDCQGKGESYILFGSEIIDSHVACQGFGTECTHKVKIDVLASGQSLKEILISEDKFTCKIFFSDDFKSKAHDEEFHMPNRSIYSPADKRYINIPKQILSKDPNATFYVTYMAENISFSTKPLFKNK